jgi:glyoxylate utilization-related uncharacterized protein
LHLHEERDVVFYVLEGEMEVYCGTEARTAKTGDAVFLPRLLPHTYRVQSPMVRFLALMQPAKGIEGYFKGLSQAVSGMVCRRARRYLLPLILRLYLPWLLSTESSS